MPYTYFMLFFTGFRLVYVSMSSEEVQGVKSGAPVYLLDIITSINERAHFKLLLHRLQVSDLSHSKCAELVMI